MHYIHIYLQKLKCVHPQAEVHRPKEEKEEKKKKKKEERKKKEKESAEGATVGVVADILLRYISVGGFSFFFFFFFFFLPTNIVHECAKCICIVYIYCLLYGVCLIRVGIEKRVFRVEWQVFFFFCKE